MTGLKMLSHGQAVAVEMVTHDGGRPVTPTQPMDFRSC